MAVVQFPSKAPEKATQTPRDIVCRAMGDVNLFNTLLTEVGSGLKSEGYPIDADVMRAIAALPDRENTNIWRAMIKAAGEL